jgi:hypothetical protein
LGGGNSAQSLYSYRKQTLLDNLKIQTGWYRKKENIKKEKEALLETGQPKGF